MATRTTPITMVTAVCTLTGNAPSAMSRVVETAGGWDARVKKLEQNLAEVLREISGRAR